MNKRAIYIGLPVEREEEGQYLGYGTTGIIIFYSKTASVFLSDSNNQWYPDPKDLYIPKA